MDQAETVRKGGRAPLERDEMGRPVRQINKGVRLKQSHIDKAITIGGNMNQGIRMALEAYEV